MASPRPNVPALKANIAKKMMAGKKFMSSPPHTPRGQGIKPKPAVRSMHGHAAIPNKPGAEASAQRHKHFSSGIHGAQMSQTKKPFREAAGWENNE